MRDKLIGIGITIVIIAGAYLAFGGQGATQKWVDYRIAEQETNTQKVVDYKITVATNNYVADIQRRIDAHLSTNGVTGAWTEYKIAEAVTKQTKVNDPIQAANTVTASQNGNQLTLSAGNMTWVITKE